MSHFRLIARCPRVSTAALGTALTAMCLWMAGCGGGTGTDSTAETPDAATTAAQHMANTVNTESAGTAEDPLAALSAEDRAVADAQQICPLSKQPLGSMGTPIKVEYEGKPVFLCCEHCKEGFEADPEKFIANLPNWQDEAAPTTEGSAPEGTTPESGAGASDTPESTETPATGEST